MKERPFIQDVCDTVRRHPWECVVQISVIVAAWSGIAYAMWVIGHAVAGLPR